MSRSEHSDADAYPDAWRWGAFGPTAKAPYRALSDQPMTVRELAPPGANMRTVQRVLKRLEAAGLATRQGRQWQRGPQTLADVMPTLRTNGATERQRQHYATERAAFRAQEFVLDAVKTGPVTRAELLVKAASAGFQGVAILHALQWLTMERLNRRTGELRPPRLRSDGRTVALNDGRRSTPTSARDSLRPSATELLVLHGNAGNLLRSAPKRRNGAADAFDA